jgi:hypothetical protein
MLFITLGDGLIGPSPVSANPLTDQTNRTNRPMRARARPIEAMWAQPR